VSSSDSNEHSTESGGLADSTDAPATNDASTPPTSTSVVDSVDQKAANSVDQKKDKPKSLVVWNYEILLVLTGLFSLWNYGSISMMTMGEKDTDAASRAPVDGNVFIFTVMATGAALTLLAILRFTFRTHFSKKMLHSPMLLLVFSIPILLLLFFIGLMFSVQAIG